jgi:hypothetical protein
VFGVNRYYYRYPSYSYHRRHYYHHRRYSRR